MRPAAERAFEHDRRARDQHYPQDDLIGVLVSLVWGPTPASEALVQGEEILEQVQGHRGAEAYALCFLGQLRGMLGQREAAREMILRGVADRQELGDLPGAAMSHGEGLGYFVEMVRGDWQAGERELRQGFDALESMGDKNYLAITAGWLAHCLYAQERYDEADDFAGVCENSAAKSWIAAQVLWRGARAMLLARGGDVEAGEALAREAVDLALRTDRVDTQTDALMDLAEVLRPGRREAEAVPIVADALRRYEAKEVRPAAARARALLEELAPSRRQETRLASPVEVDPHDDPAEGRVADLREAGGLEDAAAADVELAGHDPLARLRSASGSPRGHGRRARARSRRRRVLARS